MAETGFVNKEKQLCVQTIVIVVVSDHPSLQNRKVQYKGLDSLFVTRMSVDPLPCYETVKMRLTLLSKARGLLRKVATKMADRFSSASVCPEYDDLVYSFDLWEREVRRTNLIASAPPLLLGIDVDTFAEKNHFPPAPELIQLFSTLPVLHPEDLSEEDSQCNICFESFKPAHEVASRAAPGEINEKAIRLPCGHIFGDICFQKWHFPFGVGLNCPFCRAENFPHHAWPTAPLEWDPLTYYENCLDEIVWSDFVCGKRRSQEERASYRRDRYIAARERIDRANREWTAFIGHNSVKLKAWRERREHIDAMYWELMAASWEHERDIYLASQLGEEGWDLETDGEFIVHDYIGDIPSADTSW